MSAKIILDIVKYQPEGNFDYFIISIINHIK